MLIFIFGEDVYSSAKKVKIMQEKFIEKFDKSGMNFFSCPKKQGQKIELGDVAQAIQSQPFISEKRMIVIKGLLELITTKPDAKPWCDVFDRIPDSSIVIIYDQISVDKGKKHNIVKDQISKKDVHIYEFGRVNDEQLLLFAEKLSLEVNLNIDSRLLGDVVRKVGSNVHELELEIGKLAAYCKDRKASVEDVELLVGDSAEDQMFAFLDAISAKDSNKAIRLIEEQRLFGTDDFQLFAMIIRQLRLLISVADYIEVNPGLNKSDVARELKLHPFVAQKTMSQVRNFSKQRLIDLQSQLFELDLRIKTGILSPDIAVDRIVVELMK